MTLTFGVRNFDAADSGPLRISVSVRSGPNGTPQYLAHLDVADSLAANSGLAVTPYDIQPDFESISSQILANPAEVQLHLRERVGESLNSLDHVIMESPVDLKESFSVGDRDYLKDGDGDGVGDINERAEGTDPDDPDSTPGESTIDVLAFYSQGYPSLFDGDPTTWIQHSFELSKLIFQDSGLPIRIRLVGLVEIHLHDENELYSVDRVDLHREADRHGADLAALFRPNPDGKFKFCGTAPLTGHGNRGHIDPRLLRDYVATVFGKCSGTTLAHELGHLLGLGHARWQVDNAPTGTWRWSRGHAVVEGFFTVMSYGVRGAPEVAVFSDPQSMCQGLLANAEPCGVDLSELEGADAVTSLDAVRFQAARVRDGFEDTDNDGFVDPVDQFPDDPTEWWDTDQDGIGNTEDTDDDGDGVDDEYDAFPLDASESVDTDADGVGNNADNDDDGDGLVDSVDLLPLDPSEFVDTVMLFPSASDPGRQGFLRLINRSVDAGVVLVGVGDSTGKRYRALNLSVGASQTVNFNSEDLEYGNSDKGLFGGVGSGEGDWRLELSSKLDIDVSSYIRTMDGFLTSMHDVAPSEGNSHSVAIFNPASNRNQVSRLLVFNRSRRAADVTISGIDDLGNSPGGEVKVNIPSGVTQSFTAAELESGGSSLEGSLGDGTGKWRLTVQSDRAVTVMNLLESPTGHLSNLSTIPERDDRRGHFVPYVPAAAALNLQGFVRVINYSDRAGEVSIVAYDDGGREFGPVALVLDAHETAHFNSNDLEKGNEGKGIPVGIGPGEGDWRLEMTTNLRTDVLSYIRTADGFLTAMHDLVPIDGSSHRIDIFNPGRNLNQVSKLRLINWSADTAEVTISGVDDKGQHSSDSVQTSIPSGASRTVSADQLESGMSPGLEGALGTGDGKWQLKVESTRSIEVMSLLETPTGHLTNLSTVPGLDSSASPVEPISGDISPPEMVEIPAGRFDMGCLSNDDDCNPDELPVREVTIPRPFALSKYEVTVGEFLACEEAGGCPLSGLVRLHSENSVHWPVGGINWDDAQAYVRWLSRETGETYRLPSEAEWEYAARAGSVTKFSWGDDIGVDRANCDGCWNDWNRNPAPVGTFAPNAWGLYDMHGNVSEIVEDCWNNNYRGAPTDSSAWKTGDCTRSVVRGGNYVDSPVQLRSAERRWYSIDNGTRYANYGFRVARTLE